MLSPSTFFSWALALKTQSSCEEEGKWPCGEVTSMWCSWQPAVPIACAYDAGSILQLWNHTSKPTLFQPHGTETRCPYWALTKLCIQYQNRCYCYFKPLSVVAICYTVSLDNYNKPLIRHHILPPGPLCSNYTCLLSDLHSFPVFSVWDTLSHI